MAIVALLWFISKPLDRLVLFSPAYGPENEAATETKPITVHKTNEGIQPIVGMKAFQFLKFYKPVVEPHF